MGQRRDHLLRPRARRERDHPVMPAAAPEWCGRLYLAGRLPNTAANLEEWIRHPQKMEPGTVMPDTGVTAEDARHISAYLYSLR